MKGERKLHNLQSWPVNCVFQVEEKILRIGDLHLSLPRNSGIKSLSRERGDEQRKQYNHYPTKHSVIKDRVRDV